MISKHSNPRKPTQAFLQFYYNRKFEVFSTFLLAFLLGSSLLRASYDPVIYNPHVYYGVFAGRRFLKTEQMLRRDDALYCDRSHHRTDVCVARGDVRVVGGGRNRTYEVVVFAEGGQEREEILKPYTRKWEESVMNIIDDVKVIRKVKNRPDERAARLGLQLPPNQITAAPVAARQRRKREAELAASDQTESSTCHVRHEVPAILFSTGGYTGNVYHEFNDGLIPLYITAQKYPAGQVVLVLLEYHNWWMTKYAEILSQIANYTVIDLASDKRVHCFPEVTIGLHIHDELAIHAHRSAAGASMQGFQSMLHAAYLPRLRNEFSTAPSADHLPTVAKPKLVIISRNSPRALLNQQDVIALAEKIGFSVEVLAPRPTTEMVDIYRALSRCDVMLGVHGAAMTHLVFMRPGSTFIQVVPLGTDWAAATYYGEPAQKLGLDYVAYKVNPEESSLSQRYGRDDPVLVRPDSVNQKGWWETKRIYLEAQDVTVSLPRMRVTLLSAYTRAALRLTAS